MLAYIRTNYKAGDTVELATTQGTFVGAIEYVADQYIVLRQPNGQICGIAAADIHTFRADSPVPLVPQVVPATKAPEAPAPVAETPAPAEAETAPAEPEPAPVAQPKQPEAEPVKLAPTLPGPKVLGTIDLSQFGTRSHFSKTSNNTPPAANNAAPAADSNASTPYNSYNGYQRQPYVNAKGYITYYNNEKRFGFIHDYNSDNDLYFNYAQVADNELYDRLRKGTKVAYTMDRNAQGFAARCVHLPRPVNDLIDMANDYLDNRHYQLAQGLAEHVLDVDPDNREAKQLYEEIRDTAPTPRFAPTASQPSATQYNPCAIYSSAKKAYLAKDYAQAEELYKKAIAAGEKPESCVKDLVTLYVSRFKQAATEAEKTEAREKAIAFLDSHRQLLTDNLTTKQFLALNYYLPILDYPNFIKAVDEILADPQVAHVVSRRVFYLWQKGIALNKMGRAEEALKLADEGLAIAPRSTQLINLRNMILHPEYFERKPITFTAEELAAGNTLAERKAEAEAARAAQAAPAEAPAPAPQAVAEVAQAAVAEAEAPAAEAAPATNAAQAPTEPAAPAAEPAQAEAPAAAEPATEAPAPAETPAAETTGEPKDDDWWEDLKKPQE